MAGIYIHIPFCKQACYYCNFHFSISLRKKDELINALITELKLRKHELKNHTVDTIYFGGGTPSLLSNNELQLLISEVYKHHKVIDDPEITLEANPDDLMSVRAQSRTIFEDYKNIGINRLSIGIQSFFDEDLKLMNRAHNAHESKQCLVEATKHFENITIDLIYGIPGLTIERWIKNIETALSFNIPHISSYALTVEPKTALDAFIKKGTIENVDDGVAKEQFHILIDQLVSSGYEHYEISNFGKPNFLSKHNSAYWKGDYYLGIGPSAHSFNGEQRSWNVRNNSIYINSLSNDVLPMEIETLTVNDKYNEHVMTGLRTVWGVSLGKIEQDFGKGFKDYLLEQSQKHFDEDLLYLDGDKVLVTIKGKFLSDGIASDLFKINII